MSVSTTIDIKMNKKTKINEVIDFLSHEYNFDINDSLVKIYEEIIYKEKKIYVIDDNDEITLK